MSKIIEDEEIIKAWRDKDGLTVKEAERNVAEAQRDSSDREWVDLIKETANIGHGVVYFAIPIEQWQAINEKVEENNDRS